MDAELRARDDLIAEGYSVVKSGGSLGPFDLWAYGHGKLRLIQIKSTKYQLRFKLLQEEIRRFKIDDPFVTKELWIWYNHRPAVKRVKVENYKGWVKIVL